MSRTAPALWLAAAVTLAAATPARAQNYRFDLGVHGGGALWTSMLDDDQLGEGTDDVKFEAGWLTGAQATLWLTRRLGLRANFGYTERPIEQGDDELLEDVNLWSGSGDLLYRFTSPGREFLGIQMLPYIALGAGAKWINAGLDSCADLLDETEDCGAIFFPTTTTGRRAFVLEEDAKLMGLAALGTDIRVARNFAVRLEIGDRFFDAPISALTPVPGGFIHTEGDEDVGRVTHELFGQVGLHLLLGLERPAPVAVVTPPPAPPPPAEETITVCVIDPTAPGGIRETSAIYVPSTGDTLVVVEGRRVPLRETVATIRVAPEDVLGGAPLTVTVQGRQLQFVSFGGTRVVQPQELAFLGTVNGVPVYADEDEVQDIMEELEEARRAEGTNDLEKILEEREDLREDIEDIKVLYVPAQPTACVFQPLRRMEEVRKVRG